MKRLLALSLSALTALSVAACGGTTQVSSSEAVTGALQRDVLDVTRAAGARDATSATAALNRLHQDVTSARRAGLLTPARATRIETSAARVTADLRALRPAASRPATPTRSSTPTVRPGHGQDRKHPGKGSGGGDD